MNNLRFIDFFNGIHGFKLQSDGPDGAPAAIPEGRKREEKKEEVSGSFEVNVEGHRRHAPLILHSAGSSSDREGTVALPETELNAELTLEEKKLLGDPPKKASEIRDELLARMPVADHKFIRDSFNDAKSRGELRQAFKDLNERIEVMKQPGQSARLLKQPRPDAKMTDDQKIAFKAKAEVADPITGAELQAKAKEAEQYAHILVHLTEKRFVAMSAENEAELNDLLVKGAEHPKYQLDERKLGKDMVVKYDQDGNSTIVFPPGASRKQMVKAVRAEQLRQQKMGNYSSRRRIGGGDREAGTSEPSSDDLCRLLEVSLAAGDTADFHPSVQRGTGFMLGDHMELGRMVVKERENNMHGIYTNPDGSFSPGTVTANVNVLRSAMARKAGDWIGKEVGKKARNKFEKIPALMLTKCTRGDMLVSMLEEMKGQADLDPAGPEAKDYFIAEPNEGGTGQYYRPVTKTEYDVQVKQNEAIKAKERATWQQREGVEPEVKGFKAKASRFGKAITRGSKALFTTKVKDVLEVPRAKGVDALLLLAEAPDQPRNVHDPRFHKDVPADKKVNPLVMQCEDAYITAWRRATAGKEDEATLAKGREAGGKALKTIYDTARQQKRSLRSKVPVLGGGRLLGEKDLADVIVKGLTHEQLGALISAYEGDWATQREILGHVRRTDIVGFTYQKHFAEAVAAVAEKDPTSLQAMYLNDAKEDEEIHESMDRIAKDGNLVQKGTQEAIDMHMFLTKPPVEQKEMFHDSLFERAQAKQVQASYDAKKAEEKKGVSAEDSKAPSPTDFNGMMGHYESEFLRVQPREPVPELDTKLSQEAREALQPRIDEIKARNAALNNGTADEKARLEELQRLLRDPRAKTVRELAPDAEANEAGAVAARAALQEKFAKRYCASVESRLKPAVIGEILEQKPGDDEKAKERVSVEAVSADQFKTEFERQAGCRIDQLDGAAKTVVERRLAEIQKQEQAAQARVEAAAAKQKAEEAAAAARGRGMAPGGGGPES